MDILIIAHFISEFEKESTSRFVYIAEQLSQKHNVEIVSSSFNHTKKQQREELVHGLQCKVTLLEEPSYPKNICLKRFYSHASFGKKVKAYLANRKKPDLIYCAIPSLDCACFAAKYAQDQEIKFIVDVQDLWPEAFKIAFNVPVLSDILFFPMKKKADYIYSCADVIIGVSETYCRRAKSVNRKNAKCESVFLGTNLDCFDKYVADNRVLRNDNEVILAYCGTLGHSYDIKCVLDSLVILQEQGYRNLAFWVIGDGPLKENFEKYAREKRLNTKFYGRVPYEKMCALLSSCNICINPIIGTSEASIINKHGDYAASGLPVINTQKNTEYRMLIEKYKCGINCEISSPQSVANAIAYLINNNEISVMMGQGARRMAEDLFNRKTTYKKIFHIIDDI